MSSQTEGVYLPTSRPSTFESTPLANAGWYEEGQHGGALAGLVVAQVEKVPTISEMQIARVTLEIFRVVPLVPLTVETEVIREGKRIQTVQARVTDPDDSLLSMAVVQRLRVDEQNLPASAATERTDLGSPAEAKGVASEAWGPGESAKTMFHRNAIEVREIHGGFATIGPGGVWIRPHTPIIAGEELTPAQRAVIAADFCNGISRRLSIEEWVFMNSDLTVHIGRYPRGDWVALDASSVYGELGRGVASGTIWDEELWVGRSAQTLFLAPRRMSD